MSNYESAHSDGANFSEMTSEEKEAFFAALAGTSPKINPDGYEFFAFVVDGKVSVVFIASKQNMQDHITAFSSDPIIVKLTSSQKNVIETGWNYNDKTGRFSAPE